MNEVNAILFLSINKIPYTIVPDPLVSFTVVNRYTAEEFYMYKYMNMGDIGNILRNKIRLDLTSLNKLDTALFGFLSAIHKISVYHTDIKPENILCNYANTGEVTFAVGDYGLMSDAKNYTVRGTPGYYAPLLLYYFNESQGVNSEHQRKLLRPHDNYELLLKNHQAAYYNHYKTLTLDKLLKYNDLYAAYVTLYYVIFTVSPDSKILLSNIFELLLQPDLIFKKHGIIE